MHTVLSPHAGPALCAIQARHADLAVQEGSIGVWDCAWVRASSQVGKLRTRIRGRSVF